MDFIGVELAIAILLTTFAVSASVKITQLYSRFRMEQREIEMHLRQKEDECNHFKSLSISQQKELEERVERLSYLMNSSVPTLRDVPPPPPKKFKKQKTVNRNIIDPTTGDRLPIVRCHCGATYSEDSYNLYGCDCEKKVVSEK